MRRPRKLFQVYASSRSSTMMCIHVFTKPHSLNFSSMFPRAFSVFFNLKDSNSNSLSLLIYFTTNTLFRGILHFYIAVFCISPDILCLLACVAQYSPPTAPFRTPHILYPSRKPNLVSQLYFIPSF